MAASRAMSWSVSVPMYSVVATVASGLVSLTPGTMPLAMSEMAGVSVPPRNTTLSVSVRMPMMPPMATPMPTGPT